MNHSMIKPAHSVIAIGAVMISILVALASERENLLKRISNATGVVWLEQIAGSLQKAEELSLTTRRFFQPTGKKLRTAAYVRLGMLGTKESLAAADRIEKEVRESTITPETVSIEIWTHPCWHYGDRKVEPLAQIKAPDGTTYALVDSYMLGDLDLFLISSKSPADKNSWSRPRLIPMKPYRSIREPSLSLENRNTLVFTFFQEKPGERNIMDFTFENGKQSPTLGLQKRKIDLREVFRDQDHDGWTDVEEKRLGLNPKKSDTDGDGIEDGKDHCPNFAPRKGDDAKDEVQILQKALFATFGLSGSRHLMIVGPESRKIQVWGYLGPVIYLDDLDGWKKTHDGGAVFLDWRLNHKGNKAKVAFYDYEGPLAGSSQYITLKKINGRWTVTEYKMGYIS